MGGHYVVATIVVGDITLAYQGWRDDHHTAVTGLRLWPQIGDNDQHGGLQHPHWWRCGRTHCGHPSYRLPEEGWFVPLERTRLWSGRGHCPPEMGGLQGQFWGPAGGLCPLRKKVGDKSQKGCGAIHIPFFNIFKYLESYFYKYLGRPFCPINKRCIDMAKIFSKEVDKTLEGNIGLQQDFVQLSTINQIGDRFYVPMAHNLLVRGTTVIDRSGHERQAGQRFYAVRVIDDTPTEVVELYVGQIVKVDVNGRVVFNNPLSNALRRSGEAFKSLICNQFLEIVGSKDIEDRKWDDKTQQYERDENDRFVRIPKTALQFEVKVKPNQFNVEACEALLEEYYKEVYPQLFQ